MISTRYAPVVLVLLALALIPTVIHSYAGSTLVDGLVSAGIDPVLVGYPSKPTSRNPHWGQDIFASDDWIERNYKVAPGHKVRLFVARSYDLKRLYHHPELAVLYGQDMERAGTTSLGGNAQLPVQLLAGRARNQFAAIALLYDGEFTANPVKLQLRTALELLVSARKPMTLFMVFDDTRGIGEDINDVEAMRILKAAIDSFAAQKSNINTSKPG